MAGGQARSDDHDACMECGACATNCAEGAIELESGVGCATGLINEWLRDRRLRQPRVGIEKSANSNPGATKQAAKVYSPDVLAACSFPAGATVPRGGAAAYCVERSWTVSLRRAAFASNRKTSSSSAR